MDETKNESATNPVVIKFELPQIVNTALTPLATSIGTTLSHGWEGLTMSIETWYGRKKIDHDLNLQLYREEIQKQLSAIPEEDLQEPKMSVLGPSLDASKYYFEEEQYREMFSKLIASTCNTQKNPFVHTCFVEIIKQLDPKDAILLKQYATTDALPIAEYRLKNKTGFKKIETNVYLEENDFTELNYYSSSIVNLERLGLIKTSYSQHLTNVDLYKCYEEHPKFLLQKDMYEKSSTTSKTDFQELQMQKGVALITPLGNDFIRVCVK